MRGNHLFSLLAVLATAGCFYSDKPLLVPADYAQPIRAGLWETLVPVEAPEWKTMPASDKRANHCRTIAGEPFCAERLRLTTADDKGYELRGDGEDDYDLLHAKALDDDSFIVEQVATDGSAEYALATVTSPTEFAVRLPRCDRDGYLHAYAPPDEPGSSRCRVADRVALTRLFGVYRSAPSAEGAKVYRRISD